MKRLLAMSLPEIGWRARHAVRVQFEKAASISRIPERIVSRPRFQPWPMPAGCESAPFLAAADEILAGRIELFGQSHSSNGAPINWNQDPASGIVSPLVRGTSIDCRDREVVGEARNIWEVNRHHQVAALAQAWSISGDGRYRAEARTLLVTWLQSCPYPLGINWASALESGIRLINWYIVARFTGGWPGDVELEAGWIDSIYRHCDFIWRNPSRFSSANNHLIGEMAGLYVASCAWPCWSKSASWRRGAKGILLREAELQVHEDGVSREQAVGYQMFVLQFLVIAGLVGEQSGDPFPEGYWATVRRMLGFLRAISDGAGNLPNFGDSDDGMAFKLAPNALSRRLQDLLDFEETLSRDDKPTYALQSTESWLISGLPRPVNWPSGKIARPQSFPHGGYYILSHDLGGPREMQVVFDAGPLGYLSIAAHGHADCLSIVMSIAGHPILIDPGTYCYFADSEWRNYFRSTAAHNTVRIDGADQSQMAGPFMWLAKANPHVELYAPGGSATRVRARHDGYVRLPDPVIHTREIALDGANSILDIVDSFECRGAHQIERRWHFSEQCVLTSTRGGNAVIDCGIVHIEMQSDSGASFKLLTGSESPRGGWLSHRFGSRQEAATLVIENRIIGNTGLNTRFHWLVS